MARDINNMACYFLCATISIRSDVMSIQMDVRLSFVNNISQVAICTTSVGVTHARPNNIYGK